LAIRTFRARSVGEALALVKREMGGDAVILHTRTVKAGGVLGLGAHHITEITASDAADMPRQPQRPRDHSRAAQPAPNRGPSVHARRSVEAYANAAPQTSRPAPARTPNAAFSPRLTDEQTRERLLALARSRGIGAAPNTATPVPSPSAAPRHVAESAACPDIGGTPREADDDDGLADRLAAARRLARSAIADAEIDDGAESDAAGHRMSPQPSRTPRDTADPIASPEPRSDAIPPRAERPLTDAPTAPASPLPLASTAAAEQDADLHAELANLQKLVEEVLRAQRGAAASAGPDAVAQLYRTLLEHEVAEELADAVTAAVRTSLSEDEQADAEVVRRAAVTELAKRIPTMRALPKGGPQNDGRPLTIALLGPTGVGKTTTIAKIAAAYKLRFGHRVGLITCDTYRIAAVDQLRQYANIIGLPIEVAITPADVQHACHQLRDCDVILIDTAGRSQRDAGKIDELAALLDAARPHQRHLVLSGAAAGRVIAQAAERFAPTAPDHIVFTKLDEAVTLGPIVAARDRLGAVVSFVTTGQEVPDEIELARGPDLAEIILDGAAA